jgi:predicted kinase
MNQGRLTVVVGLPGAGKSTLVNAMRSSVSGLCCEDFHANALHDSPLVENSRHYNALLEDIRTGLDCVIADIAFCDPKRRANLQQVINRQIPNSRVEWIYFENAPDKCRRNIERRARERLRDDLDALEKFQLLYRIPDGVTPIPVPERS